MPIYWGVTHILIKLKCVDQYQIFQYCLPVHQYQRGMFAFPSFHNFSLKKYFSPSFRDLSLKKKLGDLKVFPCIMNKDVPNFVHTFSFVALDLKNVVSAVTAKTYILLQVIPQIAPVVL